MRVCNHQTTVILAHNTAAVPPSAHTRQRQLESMTRTVRAHTHRATHAYDRSHRRRISPGRTSSDHSDRRAAGPPRETARWPVSSGTERTAGPRYRFHSEHTALANPGRQQATQLATRTAPGNGERTKRESFTQYMLPGQSQVESSPFDGSH